MIDSFFSDPVPEVTRQVGRLVGQVYRTTWRLREDEVKMAEVVKVLERTVEELDALRR